MEKSDINILIIEDDASQRSALEKAISRRGYKPICVAKPEEAISVLKIKPIHALIVDCMLPGKSGVDLVMDIKDRLIESSGIYLISGIYRDRSFSSDAIKKTEAEGFYLKPLDLEKLLTDIDEKVSVFVKTPKVGLQSLLSVPLASERDRRRALDYVDGVCGYDLPFVFSILMDSKSTGDLNIVDENSNIYGVSFNQGTIMHVDTESTGEVTQKILLKYGFVTDRELQEIGENSSGDVAKKLVERGLMSPHAQDVAREEQILDSIKGLVTDRPININFVKNRKLKSDNLGLSMKEFLPDLHDMVVRKIPSTYLKKFYKDWTGHAIRMGPNFQDHISIETLESITKLPGIIDKIKEEPDLEELLANPDYAEATFFHGLHILAIRRLIVFTEVASVKDLDDYVRRLKSAYEAVKGKDPIAVYQYFGLGENPKAREVAQVYKDFAKANHPDLVPRAASDEVRDLNHKLFSLVSDAHDILTNENKKKEFYERAKQDEMQKQITSEDLLSEAYQMMIRGRFREARPLVEKAREQYLSDKSRLYYQWTFLKDNSEFTAEHYANALQDLDQVSPEGQKTAMFHFVRGLLFKRMGSSQEAVKQFLKARQVDPSFAEVRRELMALKGNVPKKMDLNEMLNGDISSVIKNFFGKKGA